MTRRRAVVAALVSLALLAAGCGKEPPPVPAAPAAAAPRPAPYPVSASGGTPATGPGDRYNDCERIWCLTHRENYFVDHFLEGHVGWVIHDARRGDVFVPRYRTDGPEFHDAGRAALRFCGRHVHPFLFGVAGGPVRHTGYNRTLGYGRDHFATYGTRLDPCCINGLGWAFLHSSTPGRFPFHDLAPYKEHPESGWQRPFVAKPR